MSSIADYKGERTIFEEAISKESSIPQAGYTPRDCDLGGLMMRSMMPYSSASLASK